MRSSRVLTLAVGIAAAAALVAIPASAGTAVVVKNSGTSFSPFSVFGGGDSTTAYVSGPATPPLGNGSLRIANGATGGTNQADVVDYLTTIPMVDVTALDAWVYIEDPSTDQIYWQVDVSSTGNNSTDATLTTTAPDTAGWHHLDVRSDPLHLTGAGGPVTTTWTQYVGGHQLASITNINLGPDRTQAAPNVEWNLDALHYARSDQLFDTTYDFESPTSSALSFPAPTSPVVSGSAVTLTTHLTDGAPLQGAPVTLWARPAGGSFTKVAQRTTSGSGSASATEHPATTTAYEWRYAGSGGHAAVTSAVRTVKVATKLTLAVADATLAAGQKLKASGHTVPVAKQVKVTLWKVRSGADLALASTTTGTDGSWQLRRTLAKGHYSLYATVAATAHTIAGRSPTVTVTAG